MSSTETIAIVGSGLAGVTAAGALRDGGYTGRVVLVNDEPDLPYDRPPLSKAVLVSEELAALDVAAPGTGEPPALPHSLALRAHDWYATQRIETLHGTPVTRTLTWERVG